jgi:hypothetical protein
MKFPEVAVAPPPGREPPPARDSVSMEPTEFPEAELSTPPFRSPKGRNSTWSPRSPCLRVTATFMPRDSSACTSTLFRPAASMAISRLSGDVTR